MCRDASVCNHHEPGGVTRRFGDRTAPLSQGFWRRFRSLGTVEDNRLFQPLAGLPRAVTGDYRTASKTGKFGAERVATARQVPQPIEYTEAARPLVFAFAQPANANGARVTQSAIDPWGTVAGRGTAFEFGKSGGKVAG